MDFQENEIPMPPYNLEEALLKEIEVRGRYLSMSCDIEYCLLQILIFCNPDPNNHDRSGKFKKMTMGDKINTVICDMKDYKQTEYIQYKTWFDCLEEFRKIRNHAAHDKMEFINKELNPVRFTFLQYDEATGKEWSRFAELPDLFIQQSLQRFGSINHHLGMLWKTLQDEYYKTASVHPMAHPSTYNVQGDNQDSTT